MYLLSLGIFWVLIIGGRGTLITTTSREFLLKKCIPSWKYFFWLYSLLGKLKTSGQQTERKFFLKQKFLFLDQNILFLNFLNRNTEFGLSSHRSNLTKKKVLKEEWSQYQKQGTGVCLLSANILILEPELKVLFGHYKMKQFGKCSTLVAVCLLVYKIYPST